MSRILREVGRFWPQLIVLILVVFGTTMSMVLLPTLFSQLIDEAIPNADEALITQIAIEMFIIVGIEIVCGLLMSKMCAVISMGVGRNLRKQVFEKVQRFSQAEVDHFSVSALITRTNNDIMQVQNFLSQCLSFAIMAPIMGVLGVCMSISKSPELSMILLIAVPALAVILVFIGKAALPLSAKMQTKLDRMNCVSREKLTGVRVIRAFGTNKFEEDKFDEINSDFKIINIKLQHRLNIFLPAIEIVIGITIAMIMYCSYGQSVSGVAGYTQGDITAIIQYIMLILMAVTLLTIVVLLLPRAAVSANRAKEILESESEILNPEQPKDNREQQGYLSFRNVSFTYKGSSKPALNNLSFDSKPGETTAIIGGTGMGKTTIVNLIPRLYDPTEGQILIDGVEIRDYDLDVLRSKIGFVPQKALLFKGTINSNLEFGDKDATHERIEKAVKIAQSYDFVSGKEGGFDADVAQGGSNFSGGQKQRLCIARAVVRKPEIYIFDDSFSALDFKTDKNLRAALSEETDNASVIIVAQRVSTIKDADRIIVVDSGNIAGIGTHRELLKNCDVYREICESQMSREEMEK